MRHQFAFTNQGDRVVNIGRVRSACGCTKTLLTTNAVPPGGTAVLSVELDVGKRRGRQSKAIYCETDDPANRVIRLEFSGEVSAPIGVEPEGIQFGPVGADGPLEREVSLTADGTNVFHILSAAMSSPLFAATVETREAGKRYVVKVASGGGRGLGPASALVRIRTDNPLMEAIDVPVAADVVGDIVPSPGSLLVIPSQSNTVRTYWLSLSSPVGKAFKVTRVDCPVPGMDGAVKSATPDRVRIELRTWGPLAGLDGKSIRVATDLPAMREVLIPVRVLPMPGGQPEPGQP